MDRFGWDRDRGTSVQDRLICDWMDALQDYPLSEVRDACRKFVATNPSKMPNEGHILAIVKADRAIKHPIASLPKVAFAHPPKREPCSPEAAAEIMQKAGFAAKTFPKVGDGKDE